MLHFTLFYFVFLPEPNTCTTLHLLSAHHTHHLGGDYFIMSHFDNTVKDYLDLWEGMCAYSNVTSVSCGSIHSAGHVLLEQHLFIHYTCAAAAAAVCLCHLACAPALLVRLHHRGKSCITLCLVSNLAALLKFHF